MKFKLLTPLCLISGSLFAQNNQDKGYIINLSGERIEAEIQYQDWARNPTTIDVIIGGQKIKYSPKQIIGFGFDNGVFYESYNGKIDQSSQFYNRLSEDKEPEWIETSVFLKRLIQGPAQLYVHDNNTVVTYYFKKEGEEIKPLIYKIYKNQNGQSAYNEQFKNQLRANVFCGDANFKSLKYKASDLENYFVEYNQCTLGDEYQAQTKVYTKNRVEFGVQAGIRSEKNYVHYPAYAASHEFSATSPTVGLNIEYQFPFLQNKYAVAVEANYFHFKRQDVQANPRFGLAIERKIIEIPVGLQYYLLKQQDHKAFIGAFYNIKIDLANANYTEVVYSETNRSNIENISSFSLGAGYQWKNLGIKARYNLKSNFEVGEYMKGNTSSFSVNLFYKFAKMEF